MSSSLGPPLLCCQPTVTWWGRCTLAWVWTARPGNARCTRPQGLSPCSPQICLGVGVRTEGIEILSVPIGSVVARHENVSKISRNSNGVTYGSRHCRVTTINGSINRRKK
eukprot:1194984-Prorocentrum_minimum.AAC.2